MINVGQQVYLRHRPLGRNKIQDSWGPTVYKVIDVQGTTYTVEPLEGGPIKRLHRTDLRPCVTSLPEPEDHPPKVQEERKDTSELVEVQSDPDFVVLEEVTYPSLQETNQIGIPSADSDGLVDQSELILDDPELQDSEPKQVVPDISPALRVEEPVLMKPVPTPRRTKRANAALCSVSECVQRQYHFISENKTWTEAQSYCRENYTDLATVDNMNDMNELNKTLKYGGLQYVWIGLQRKWQWSSGEPALYLNWGFAQPDGRDECAFMKNGKWEDGSCNDILTFICNSSNKDKLIVITENLTWSEALRYCRQNHVDLVSVHSEEIQRRVMNVVKQASTSAVWLGLRHSCTVGIWFWVSGETVCYQNWAPGNGTSEEDCEHTVRSGAVQSGGDQHWISRHETDKLNFICSRYE
ncbi:macrophage mannose receptor 1-like protein [Labeo rohita]|uniref:Macrophage mannose receptor 1-like protein n=1 Tax=Labeo rohita TaxID=84645 RepID=A0A498P0V5_LABRO|nr:macrophage mannose receptor 1-like protein [Labeo rohita]